MCDDIIKTCRRNDHPSYLLIALVSKMISTKHLEDQPSYVLTYLVFVMSLLKHAEETSSPCLYVQAWYV